MLHGPAAYCVGLESRIDELGGGFGFLTQTFIAAPRCGELSAPWIVDKAMDRAAFDLWIETQLAPALAPGDIVILDNSLWDQSYPGGSMLHDWDTMLHVVPVRRGPIFVPA